MAWRWTIAPVSFSPRTAGGCNPRCVYNFRGAEILKIQCPPFFRLADKRRKFLIDFSIVLYE
eukprot:5846265-Prymnesium_polylepis.2